MLNKFFLVLVCSLLLISTALPAKSDDSPTTPVSDPAFEKAALTVKKGDYKQAIVLLQDIVAKKPNNADAWNYIGFSHRKLGQMDEALKGYKKALAINPDHKGAHEYLGELYVETGRMDKAKHHLAKLDGLCFFGCEEYDDLKAAIKAAGG